MDIEYGKGQFGGDLYTGVDAINVFSQLKSTQQNDQDDKKKGSQKKSTDEERQAALDSWNEKLLSFNKFMINFMEFKMFAESFAEMSPLKVKPFAKPVGSLTIEAGGAFSASEVSAAKYMQKLGYKVDLRNPIGTRAAGGTSDLVVNGKNYDVYTPTTTNPSRIISGIAKKNSQASGIVLDLSHTNVTASQLGDVLSRVRGLGQLK